MKIYKFSNFWLILLISTSCLATINVEWTMLDLDDEVFQSDGTTSLPINSVWQLIWTPDSVVSPFSFLNPFEVDSSEILLEELRNVDPGYIFNEGGDYVGTNYSLIADGLVGGYVYTRVFDYQGNTSTFILNDLDGMNYAVSSAIDGPLADTDTDPGPPGISTQHQPFKGPTVVDQTFTVIPEPTTIAVLLMGLLGLLGFRKHLRH